MTPSLTVTFLGGAVALVIASLVLWVAGARLKKEVLARHAEAEEIALGEVEAAALLQASSPAPPGEKDAEIREKRDAAAKAALRKERKSYRQLTKACLRHGITNPFSLRYFRRQRYSAV